MKYRSLTIALIITAILHLAAPISFSSSVVEAQTNSCPPEIATANADSSTAAKRVLAYLWALQFRDDNRVIIGQFGAYGDGTNVVTAQAQLQKVFEQTGKHVALTGMDYRNWDLDHENDLSIPNEFLIEQWRQGSLINISWHASNPWTGGSATDWEFPAGSYQARNVRELIQSGSAANTRWMAMLDHIASGLQELQEAGVVVLWRPFHEMNGGWFWWHLQAPEDFAALWQHMFNYFTKEKKLNNLLWGYSPNTNNNEWNKRTDYFYPGAAYVDIVGLDKYRPLEEDPLELDTWKEYADLINKCKPFGIFEFGPTPADSQPDRPQWDYSLLLRDIRESYPKTVFVQAWEWHWAIGEHQGADALLNDDWAITQDELPDFSAAE